MKVGPSERGGKGGRAKKMVVFFDTSNLFQSGGSDCTHHITTHLLGFSDLHTALKDLYSLESSLLLLYESKINFTGLLMIQ